MITLPLMILITSGLGALVIAGFAAFAALRGPVADRREALAACFAALVVAVSVAAVAASPVFWGQP